MAFTGQTSNKVWQKVKIALLGQSSSLTAANPGAPTPAAQEAFQDLKKFLAQQKGNADLQFCPFTAEDAIVNGGTSLVGGACTFLALYAKGRRSTGTTSSFLAVHDAADNSATTTSIVTARFKATSQEYAILAPNGIAIATDVVISAATAVAGSAESSAADAADGFVLVSA